VADRDPLRGVLTGDVTPRGCLAVRLARGHSRHAGETPLGACAVCGTLDAEIACDPLVSAGEAIGSVLVAGLSPIGEDERAALRAAAATAAPVLARQRDRAAADERAVTDALTGLPNRRAADSTLRRLGAHAGRALSPLSVVLIDLDRFSLLNDRHGHSHGDRALTAFGRLLGEAVRASDFAARLGGTEFLIALPDTDRLGAIEVAEKLRGRLERTPLVATGPITASFGVASLPEDAVDVEQLLRRADRALHLAKVQGRNRVVAAHT
jgi:diguanylate cyclase (GGDEF)-like protein